MYLRLPTSLSTLLSLCLTRQYIATTSYSLIIPYPLVSTFQTPTTFPTSSGTQLPECLLDRLASSSHPSLVHS
jgi:hypothetical protein